MRPISHKLSLVEVGHDTQSAPVPPTPPRLSSRHAVAVAVGAALVALVVLSLLYTRVAQTVTVNSDHASIVLEAAAVLHGNPMLRGWTLTNVSFYTLDLPFYVAAVALQGLKPAVMREVPAVVYALTVLAAVWLAGRGKDRRAASMGRLVTFILAGLPALAVPQVVLVGVDHVVTTLAMIVALLALDTGEERPLTKGRVALFGLACTLLVIGDTMGLWLFMLPLLLLAGGRLWNITKTPSGTLEGKRREQALLLATLAPILLADGFLTAVRFGGGFIVIPLHLQIVTLHKFGDNIVALIQGLLSMFRADIFGEDIGASTAGRGVNLLGLGFVLWGLYRALRGWRGWLTGSDRVTPILALSMAINLAAFLVDSSVSNFYNTLYSPVERYLVPFFLLGAILAGRFGVEVVADRPWLKPATALAGVVAVAFFGAQLLAPRAEIRAAGLAHWLTAHSLTDGYGNFWCSSITTVESGGAVRVRPLDSPGRLVYPMRWFSEDRWFKRPAHFLVFDMAQGPHGPFYWQHIDPHSATETFGTPDETDHYDGYTILVWHKDITPCLPH